MKRVIPLLALFAIYVAPAYSAPTQTPKPVSPSPKQAQPLPPQKYEMAMVLIADGKPNEYIFVINNAVGYKTLASLKESLGTFPPGSTLTWAPSDCRLGDETRLIDSAVAELQAFCPSKKIKFVLVPGG